MKFNWEVTTFLHLVAQCCGMGISYPERPLPTRCHPSLVQPPNLEGVQYVSIEAKPTYNFSALSLPPASLSGRQYTIDFCNVTVTYTHPGWNDLISVSVWLPLDQESWNSRLWAVGGAGYAAGVGPLYMTQAVEKGYVALMTDSGHTATIESATDASWAITSTGNLNLPLLYDFGSRTLGEMAPIGKKITQDLFGQRPQYSYFSGCSQGGRQGLEVAQRFPHDYDGILAAAPALQSQVFIPAALWANQVMRDLNVFPSPCEVDAFTQAAVQACDELDGLNDGIISMPRLCNFTAASVVDKEVDCGNARVKLSADGAAIVQAAWDGPHSEEPEDMEWPGLGLDSDLTTAYITTACTDGVKNCSAVTSPLIEEYYQYFLARDPTYSVSNLTREGFFAHLRSSQRQFGNIMSSADPNLTNFKASGGKMITWHGLADEVIPCHGTTDYYTKVAKIDPDAKSFFRHFNAPGVGHCMGGVVPFPGSAFDTLVKWVESGAVPTRLEATGSIGTRLLCPFPSEQMFITSNTTSGAGNFYCVE